MVAHPKNTGGRSIVSPRFSLTNCRPAGTLTTTGFVPTGDPLALTATSSTGAVVVPTLASATRDPPTGAAASVGPFVSPLANTNGSIRTRLVANALTSGAACSGTAGSCVATFTSRACAVTACGVVTTTCPRLPVTVPASERVAQRTTSASTTAAFTATGRSRLAVAPVTPSTNLTVTFA